MSTTLADLLERNKAYLAKHTPFPTIADIKASNSPTPTTLVVTCIDPRCVPESFLNLHDGEVVVCRNAGGNVKNALRDITIIDQLFDLQELVIIHHTDCGTLQRTEDQMRSKLKAVVDESHWPEVDEMIFGANTDMVESVKEDLHWVRSHPLIQDKVKKGTQGFVFDIKTGDLLKVSI